MIWFETDILGLQKLQALYIFERRAMRDEVWLKNAKRLGYTELLEAYREDPYRVRQRVAELRPIRVPERGAKKTQSVMEQVERKP